MLTTTLGKLKNYKYSWLRKKIHAELGVTYPKDTPLPLERVLEISCLHYTLQALRTVDGHRKAMCLYICNCMKYSLNFFEQAHPHDKCPRQYIEAMERATHGQATDKELSAAWTVAQKSAWAAADAASAAIAKRVSSKLGMLARMDYYGPGSKFHDNYIDFSIDADMSEDAAKVARKLWDSSCDPANNVAWNIARAASDAATWNAKYIAVSVTDVYEAYSPWLSAWSNAVKTFKREFIRLCRLEGEYG